MEVSLVVHTHLAAAVGVLRRLYRLVHAVLAAALHSLVVASIALLAVAAVGAAEALVGDAEVPADHVAASFHLGIVTVG